MTPAIDDIEAALPHVPAGIHCGDLTEADDRRAFAVTVHEIVVRAMRRPQVAPDWPAGARNEVEAEFIADGLLPTLDNGIEVWVHPDDMTEGTRKVAEARLRGRLSDAHRSSAIRVPENQDGRNNGVSSREPDPELEALLDEEERIARERQTNPAPLVEWGVDEARVNWGPPKPGTHESDIESPWRLDRAIIRDGRYIGGAGVTEYDAAAAWSRENAR